MFKLHIHTHTHSISLITKKHTTQINTLLKHQEPHESLINDAESKVSKLYS